MPAYRCRPLRRIPTLKSHVGCCNSDFALASRSLTLTNPGESLAALPFFFHSIMNFRRLFLVLLIACFAPAAFAQINRPTQRSGGDASIRGIVLLPNGSPVNE